MRKEVLVTAKQFYTASAVPLVADDVNAYELVFRASEDISGASFVITATRPDGQQFTDMGTVLGKTARYTMKNDLYAVEGPLKIRVTLIGQDGTVLTTNEVLFDVLPGNGNNNPQAETNYPILTQLILDVQSVADVAETKGMYAENAAEEAKAAAAAANTAAKRTEAAAGAAEELVGDLKTVIDRMPPAYEETDEGKILYLSKAGGATEMQDFSESYDSADGVILDAGLLDEETAFIDIGTEALFALGVTNPLDEQCVFGFVLIPDGTDYSADFDVVAEKVEETDDGYRMIFPAELCQPFADNNIQSAEDLFSIFEQVQFNGEIPVSKLSPVWGAPETVLNGAFLDEYVLSPAAQLAQSYTDGAIEKAVYDVTTDMNAKDEMCLEAAQQAMDFKDAAILESAKAYTDEEVEKMGTLGSVYTQTLITGEDNSIDSELQTLITDIEIIKGAEEDSPTIIFYDASGGRIAEVQGVGKQSLNIKGAASANCYDYYSADSQFILTCDARTTLGKEVDAKLDETIQQAVLDSWEVAV